MDTIDSIVGSASAESLAQVQMAAAMKILKISQNQGQSAVQLVDAAMENLQSSIENVAGDLGSTYDSYA